MNKLLCIAMTPLYFYNKFFQFLLRSTYLIFLIVFPFLAKSQFTTYNAGQAFTCITVDSNYNIWAGTSKAGIYMLDKKSNPNAIQFSIVSSGSLSTYNIQTLAADQYKNVWVGHNGQANTGASGGGIERFYIDNPGIVKHYVTDANAECLTFVARDGLASSNSASITVDKNGTVWSAHKYHDLLVTGAGGVPGQYILTPGSLSFKPASSETFFSKGTYRDYKANNNADAPELPYPAYTCDPPISQSSGLRNCYAVATGNNQVWVSVGPYQAKTGEYFNSRLLSYDLQGKLVKSFDYTTIGIANGGVFNGIWITAKGDVWVTTSAQKGFAVRRKGNWTYMNSQKLACIFPAGASLNTNAIWGNKLGQVFIGTNRGLIVYNGTGPVGSVSSYTLYTTQNNALLSDNILGGASEKDSIQWIATDKGIMKSTLGGNYPLSVEDVDYKSCQNQKINDIEAQSDMDLSKRIDYHQYRVETQICSTDGPNGDKCNAQNIYKLMMKDASLTAPSPIDYPHDNPTTLMLLTASKDDLNEIVARINAWQPSAGAIQKIRDVISPAQYIKFYQISNSEGKFPFESLFTYAISNDLLQEQQKKQNPEAVVPCAPYYLFNSSNFIYDRTQFKNWTPCGSLLTSATYDQVWIYPNDKDLTITNYTQPGHFLSPGKVVRTVIEECGKVKIVTIGTGLSDCNALQGSMNATGNVVAGSILFKNIDLKVIKGFEKL